MSTRCIEPGEGSQAESFEHNAELVRPLIEMADAKRCTPARLALARLLAQGLDVAPMPGTKCREHQRQTLAALRGPVSLGEVASLSRAIHEARVEGTHNRKGQLPLRGV